jgi:uncharacterized protein with GYD domain
MVAEARFLRRDHGNQRRPTELDGPRHPEDQGFSSASESIHGLCEKQGVKIREQLITIGPHNMLVVLEGSEEAIGTVMISLQKKGNVRSLSMRALTPETFIDILEKVE